MGAFSLWHWLVLLVVAAAFIIPAWRIAAKAGFPGALSLLLLVPLLGIVLLWVFAFIRWPVERA
jgi:hypothetical protein